MTRPHLPGCACEDCAKARLSLVTSESELMRKLSALSVDAWWPAESPGLAEFTISPGWRVMRHGTRAYCYIDGQKPGNLRYRINIANELVASMSLRCTRRMEATG